MNIDLEALKLYLRLKWFAVAAILLVISYEKLTQAITLPIFRSEILGLIIVFATGLILRWLIRQKNVSSLITYCSLLLDLGVIFTALYFVGGAENPWWFLPVMIIFISGYLFDLKVALVYATLCSSALSLLFGLEFFKLVPHYPAFGTDLNFWKYPSYLVHYLFGMLLLYYAGSLISGYFNRLLKTQQAGLENNLVSVQASGKELKNTQRALLNVMEDLSRSHDELEQRVHERTAELEEARNNLEKKVAERTSDLEAARKATLHLLKNLKEDMIKLQAIDRLKTEFLSMVSHELRTPLTPIKGYLSLLLNAKMGALSPAQISALEVVERQSMHLHDLIESMLDISRLELGKPIPIKMQMISLEKIINEVVEALAMPAQDREIDLKLETAPNLPCLIADEIKLKRIITNLLGNAIKFTPKGGEIKIRVFSGGSNLKLEISDSGIGISAEHLEKIFDKFYQIDSSYTRATGGIGMGLAIARELVGLHHGKIWAESPGPGKGAKFVIVLPLQERNKVNA